MKLQKFEIYFDTPQAVVCAGSNISGNVVVQLGKPLKVKCLQVVFQGHGKSQWIEKHGKSSTKYKARELYLDYTIVLAAPPAGQNSDTVIIDEGHHVYPFQFTLNHQMPSSFEGRKGYVRYTCVAVLDRPWKFDEKVKRAFTVIHHLDLNRVVNASVPIFLNKEETIDGCCFSSGQVNVSLKLNKSAYVPGEPIAYDIDLQNESDENITEVHLKLKQLVSYTGYSDNLFSSGKPHYHTKQDTINLYGGTHRCSKGQNIHISRACNIPSLPPSKLEGCNIIDIGYFVSLHIPCGWSSLRIEKEILIGTIPVIQMPIASAPVIPDQRPAASIEQPAQPTAPPAYTAAFEAPPSYEECVYGGVNMNDDDDEENIRGNANWAPAYPYYNWNQHDLQTYGSRQVETARPDPPAYNQI